MQPRSPQEQSYSDSHCSRRPVRVRYSRRYFTDCNLASMRKNTLALSPVHLSGSGAIPKAAIHRRADYELEVRRGKIISSKSTW